MSDVIKEIPNVVPDGCRKKFTYASLCVALCGLLAVRCGRRRVRARFGRQRWNGWAG